MICSFGFSPQESSLKQTNDLLKSPVKKKQSENAFSCCRLFGQFPGSFSARVSDLKSNLFKGCKEQGNVLVSPKEVQSKSTCSRTKVQTEHQNKLEVNAREQVQERKWQ
ncbi:hypothetical protein Tco_0180579 [Tanacetum coccineum]